MIGDPSRWLGSVPFFVIGTTTAITKIVIHIAVVSIVIIASSFLF